MAANQLAERIEGRIDPGVMSALAITGSGARTPSFQSMRDVLEFAKVMAVSGIAIRAHLRNNPGACAAICMQAARWEMDPYTVANKSYAVNDQLAYESQLITAVINTRAPIKGRLKTRFAGEGPKRKCIASAIFEGDVEPTEVSSPEFALIQPKNSPLWKTDPDQQLAYYTKRLWARRECPEVLLGVYDPEEIEAPRGPETARDVTPPRPTRADIERPIEVATDDAADQVAEEWEFTDSEGEVRAFQSPADWARIFINCLMANMLDAAHKDGIWETNSPLLARLRELGVDGEKLAAEVHAANDTRLADEDKRKQAEAAQSQDQAADAKPADSDAPVTDWPALYGQLIEGAKAERTQPNVHEFRRIHAASFSALKAGDRKLFDKLETEIEAHVKALIGGKR